MATPTDSVFHTLFDNKPLSFERLTLLQRQIAKHKPYIVYFTARSGSSYLADLLTKSEVAGRPGEYLSPLQLPKMFQARERKDPATVDSVFGSIVDYLLWLLENRSSDNGAFGLKAAYPHVRPLLLSGLDRVFFHGFTKFFLTRNNLLNQAISLYVMTETKLSHRNRDVSDEVVSKVESLRYDGARIRHWMLHLWKHEREFRKYFKDSGETVRELEYQTLSDDPAGVLRQITHDCGIAEPRLPPSDFQQVRGSKNAHLAAEFLKDLQNDAFLKTNGIPESRLSGA